ncbi:hypothetical protein GGF32_000781 [Allomyces javanicus]|nr:hypothetical protein GGF32_000781 [Allomyces javanicus]
MGGTSSKYDGWHVSSNALRGTRYDQIVLVDDAYVLPDDEPMRHFLLEHRAGLSLSGYYNVLDAESRTLVFSTEGRAFGLKEFEVVDVRTNTPVVNVYEEPFTFGYVYKYELRRPRAIAPGLEGHARETLATIRIEGHSPRGTFNPNMTMRCQVTRPDLTATITLKVKGGAYFVFLGHPMDQGAVLLARAAMDRKFLEGDTMKLTVAPGVDVAGMVALCVLADEAQRRWRKND